MQNEYINVRNKKIKELQKIGQQMFLLRLLILLMFCVTCAVIYYTYDQYNKYSSEVETKREILEDVSKKLKEKIDKEIKVSTIENFSTLVDENETIKREEEKQYLLKNPLYTILMPEK